MCIVWVSPELRPGTGKPAAGQPISNPPWTKERRLAAWEFADQVAKSRWLRIQPVKHVFPLTFTN